MRRALQSSAVVIATVFLTAGVSLAQATEEAPPPEVVPAKGMQALRKVLVHSDYGLWRPDMQPNTLAYVRGTTLNAAGSGLAACIKGLAETVIRRRLGLAEGAATSQAARVECSLSLGDPPRFPANRNRLALEATVALTLEKGQRPVAEEILDEVMGLVRKKLAEMHDAYTTALRKTVADLEARIEQEQAERDKALAAKAEHEKQLPDTFDATDNDEEYRQYHRLVGSVELELAGKKARLDEALQQVARTRAQAEAKSADDLVCKELGNLIKVREQEVDVQRQLYKRGAADVASVQAAEGKLAEAKVRLIQRQETVAERVGGGVLLRLNEELAVLGLDTVELNAKLRAARKRLDELGVLRRSHRLLDEAVSTAATLEKSIKLNRDAMQPPTRRLEEVKPPEVISDQAARAPSSRSR